MTPGADAPADVCLTNPFAWPYVKRGTETLMRSLGSWLHDAGRRVEILAGGPRRDAYDLDGVRVTLVRARPMRWIHGDLDDEVTVIPGMALHLRRTRPRLVHSFLFTDASAARVARRPYVVSYGGISTRRSGRGHPVKRALFRFATEGARVVLCPSVAAAKHLLDTFGYRARVVPNGFRIGDFPVGETDRERIILCTATPEDERKRVRVLVDAYAVVHRQRPDVQLVLAGRATEVRRRALLDRLPEAARRSVRFVGDVDTDELRRWYQRAAVSCLPSLNEAFGLVLVESLACGTPVVGARSGAIPEIVDDSIGALFGADDADGCAAALLEVLDRSPDPALQRACRARAERYDWGVVGPQLLQVYAEAAA